MKKMEFGDILFLCFGTIGLLVGGKGYAVSATCCIILSAIIFVGNREKKDNL